MAPLVLLVGGEEQLMAGHLGAELDAGQEGSAELAMQGVGFLRRRREPVLEHDCTQLAYLHKGNDLWVPS